MTLVKFRIYYVKGKENARVDTLNRRPDYAKGNKPEEYQMFKMIGTTLIYTKP
jgi:hypothetical protein